jgi:hypothetical protein
VEVACIFLRGRAQDWFVSRDLLVQSGQAVQFGSWGEFVRELTAAFRPVELTAQHTQDLLTIAQGKHDMRVYVANFNSARSRVAGALDERTLSHVFLRGCRHDLRQAIALQNPQSFDAYVSAAVLVADLMRSVDSSKFEQVLVTGYCDENESDYLDEVATDIKAVRIVGLGRSVSVINDLLAFTRLIREIKRFNPDVIWVRDALVGIVIKFFMPKTKMICEIQLHQLQLYLK